MTARPVALSLAPDAKGMKRCVMMSTAFKSTSRQPITPMTHSTVFTTGGQGSGSTRSSAISTSAGMVQLTIFFSKGTYLTTLGDADSWARVVSMCATKTMRRRRFSREALSGR